MVRRLLDTGKTDLDARDNDGQTPLMLAARKGHGAVVKLLLAMGKANVNAKNKDSWTPLSWATEEGSKDMAELLLKAGAKVNYEYGVGVSKSAPSLVHSSVKSIANPSVSGCYRM